MLPEHLQDSLHELNIDVPRCRSILLVDDEPENRDVLAALLEETYEVYTAVDGEDALEVIASMGTVDLIIADQRMPRMTGVELLSKVAEHNPETVRIVLTAFSDVEPMLEAINRGSVYRFLLKPFDSAEIRAIVKDALQLKSTTIALRMMVNALMDRREAMDSTLKMLDETQQKLLSTERKATLGRVTTGIVHDLGNLSASLSFLMDSVRQCSGADEPLRRAEEASASLGSLLEMLRQIRDLAQSSDVEATLEKVEVARFMEETVHVFSMEGISGSCEVQLEIEPGLSFVELDRGLIRQAVMALLRNAALATDGRAPIELHVSPTALGTDLRIDVRDHGCGMDMETLKQASQPFFSAFDPPGPGLGLEIARLNAEAHKGHLKLESTPASGTRASILLPGIVTGEQP